MRQRTSLLLLFFVVFLSSFIYSCKKDKSEDKKDQITYKSTDYPMGKAAAVHWSSKTMGNPLTLVFISPECKFLTTGNVLDSMSGVGNGIAFELYGTDSTQLIEGTYVYDSTANYAAGTFDYVSLVLNKDLSQNIDDVIDCYGGSVVVKKSGSEYEISWEGKDKSGNTITLYYKGIVNEYKESSKKQNSLAVKWY